MNKSHVNIIMLYVDLTYFGGKGQKYATTEKGMSIRGLNIFSLKRNCNKRWPTKEINFKTLLIYIYNHGGTLSKNFPFGPWQHVSPCYFCCFHLYHFDSNFSFIF